MIYFYYLQPELYLCTPVKIDTNNTYYIVGFEPNATMHTAHHIILYGCGKPGSADDVWNCGEMVHHDQTKLTSASPCAEESEVRIKILYITYIYVTSM